jgi:hypothetical protein
MGRKSSNGKKHKEIKNIRISRRLFAASMLIIGILLPGGCTRRLEQRPVSSFTAMPTLNLPEPIQQRYRDAIFTVTWFEQPFDNYYYHLALYNDGSVSHGLLSNRSEKGGLAPYRLSDEKWMEVRSLLESLAHSASHDPFAGRSVITLSFVWHGEYREMSFNESSCPIELSRLIEIAGTTFRGTLQSPCQKRDGDQRRTSPLLPQVELPERVRLPHSELLLRVIWFEQPFAGLYHELRVFADSDISYGQRGDNAPPGGRLVAGWWLTESEEQEIQTALISMASTSSIKLPAEGTTITVGFPWEADYHLLVFEASHCPTELQLLFEMTDMVFKREKPEYNAFQNPCQ